MENDEDKIDVELDKFAKSLKDALMKVGITGARGWNDLPEYRRKPFMRAAQALIDAGWTPPSKATTE